MSSITSKNILSEYYNQLETELFQNVLPFWNKYSLDSNNDGFYSCLDSNGEVYDTRKFMWLNGRQIYMYSLIAYMYNDIEITQMSNGLLNRANLLKEALKAADFMYKNGVIKVNKNDNENQSGILYHKVYFSLNSTGKPYHFERKIFSACFLCLGLGALAGTIHKDNGNNDDRDRCLERCILLLNQIISLSHDPSPLGRDNSCTGALKTSPMNIPMIILNILEELQRFGTIKLTADLSINIDFNVEEEEERCIDEILKHVNFEKQCVFESVLLNNNNNYDDNDNDNDDNIDDYMNNYELRHLNPGHAIEAGWFVLQYAIRKNDMKLHEIATNMINWSFSIGWDKKHDGILYFLDSEGKSPPFLEWDMKLWWPHCEAMIAFSMLYEHSLNTKEKSKEDEALKNFIQVTEYTLKHFSDKDGGGEWYGYLNRQGQVTHRFKGGPYKGCFHVPRALLMTHHLIGNILKKI